jgi:hypothetical protein
MGYTRYWKTTENRYDADAINTIKNIIQIAKEDYGIIIRGPDGFGEPIINDDYIALNGDRENNLEHETFLIENGQPDEFNFCKTARKPYDLVVNAIATFMFDEGFIDSYSSDGPNDEHKAEDLLLKATNRKTRFVLEAYDKDNSVYETIAEADNIKILKAAFHPHPVTMASGEPIDWFIITDRYTEKPVEYFDTYENTWKAY